MNDTSTERPLLWVASSKRDFMEMPDDVLDDFGFGLHQAQNGKMPDIGKILKGFGGASVIELADNCKEGTFRAVYTVRFEEVIVIPSRLSKEE
ncbi:MAG: type II toxin-antitoxin system RelE/ParE family toxin [Chlamydiota bacterium]